MKHYLQTKTNDTYDLFRPVFFDEQHDLRTNIKETEDSYELDVEMPGYTKEQIKISLEQGYLVVSAKKESKEGDGDEKGVRRFIRKEITESCQRSYFVGEDVTDEQIKAKYNNGILSLIVPKSKPKQIQSKFISIE